MLFTHPDKFISKTVGLIYSPKNIYIIKMSYSPSKNFSKLLEFPKTTKKD